MRKISLDSKIGISQDALIREIEGESVLLNLKSGIYFGLNSVGTRIWHLLQQFQSLKKVLPVLAAEYQVGLERCQKDLLSLIAALDQSGLVQILNDET